jgi:hypothetical protein
MIGSAITLTRVVTNIETHHATIRRSIIAKQVIAGAQDSHSLIVESFVAAGLLPRTNLFGKALQLLAFDPRFAQEIPPVNYNATRYEKEEQN